MAGCNHSATCAAPVHLFHIGSGRCVTGLRRGSGTRATLAPVPVLHPEPFKPALSLSRIDLMKVGESREGRDHAHRAGSRGAAPQGCP
jgi:hypothetical protein